MLRNQPMGRGFQMIGSVSLVSFVDILISPLSSELAALCRLWSAETHTILIVFGSNIIIYNLFFD